MSEPTYRIEIEYDPTEETVKWSARVYLLTTGKQVKTFFSADESDVTQRARQWIKAVYAESAQASTLYASEDGQWMPEPEPQSLRA